MAYIYPRSLRSRARDAARRLTWFNYFKPYSVAPTNVVRRSSDAFARPLRSVTRQSWLRCAVIAAIAVKRTVVVLTAERVSDWSRLRTARQRIKVVSINATRTWFGGADALGERFTPRRTFLSQRHCGLT